MFLSFIEPIFAGNVPLVSLIFLKRSLVIFILFSSIFLHWSLRKAFLSLLAIFWNTAFTRAYLSFSPFPLASLLFWTICKTSSDNLFAFLFFFFFALKTYWACPSLIRTRPRFPHSQSLPSGSLNTPLILPLHGAERMKTTLTKN